MKKTSKLLLLLAVAVSLAFGACMGSIMQKNKNKSMLWDACARHASDAAGAFLTYQKTNDTSEYRRGISAFYAYLRVYLLLNEEADEHYRCCNELHWYLTAKEDAATAHLDELISALELLSERGNGGAKQKIAQQQIFDIRNQIKHNE